MPELQGDDWAHQALSIAKVVSYAADFPSAESVVSASSSEVLGVSPDSAHDDWQAMIVPRTGAITPTPSKPWHARDPPSNSSIGSAMAGLEDRSGSWIAASENSMARVA